MIFVICTIILYFFIKSILIDKDYNKKFPLFVALIGALTIECLVSSAFNLASWRKETSSSVINQIDLIALQDNNGVSGRFFLGCGSVNDEMRYAFYYETELGIKYDSISAEDNTHPVYIKYLEDPSDSPYILQYGEVENTVYEEPKIPSWISLLYFIFYAGYEDGDIIETTICNTPGVFSNSDDYRYEIWIPEGSILQEYELDLN